MKEQYVQKPSLENLLRGLYTRFDFELRFEFELLVYLVSAVLEFEIKENLFDI